MTTQVPPDLLQTPYRKNAIINGNFDIWQRGTSVAAPNGVVSIQCDRFSFYNDRSTGAATYLRSTDVPTFAQCGTTLNYSLEIDITTALVTPSGTNEAIIFYNAEGYDYAKLHGGNATLSFWVKSNKTGIYSTSLRNADNTRSYVVEYTIDVADAWEKKIIIIPLNEPTGTWDTTNGKGVSISWALMAAYATTSTFGEWLSVNTPYSVNNVNLFDNTANYFRLAGVQFEKGDVATDLEHRPFGEELSLCQRYYETSVSAVMHPGVVSGGVQTTASVQAKFTVIKSSTPTITYTLSNTSGNGTIQQINTYGFEVVGATADTTSIARLVSYTADAEL